VCAGSLERDGPRPRGGGVEPSSEVDPARGGVKASSEADPARGGVKASSEADLTRGAFRRARPGEPRGPPGAWSGRACVLGACVDLCSRFLQVLSGFPLVV
jgi:hypothetical protein